MNKLINIKSPNQAICQFCKDVSKAYFHLKLRDTEKPQYETYTYDDPDEIPTHLYCIEHFENLIDELKNELGTLKLKKSV